MTFEARKKFTFVSKGLPEETFSVVKFKGTEGISRLYEFDITLVSENPDIDLKAALKNVATFAFVSDDGEEQFKHGILARFEQLHEVDQYVFYRALLVPRLWKANLYHENQLFLDKSVQDIIETILKQAGLTGLDYEFKLTGKYPQWEYICQYAETDFNFISRWMEREGIYYYFEQGDDAEKLIVTDSTTAHQDISGEATRYYAPPSGLIPEEEVVTALVCRQTALPNKVILKDYNYRKPLLEQKAEAEVDADGHGNVYFYGDHFKSPEQGKALAKVRAEELLSREMVFHGESTATNLSPGFLFKLDDHYRESCNQKYLITEVEHEGRQSGFLVSEKLTDQVEGEKAPAYVNRFVSIPVDVQYRPERKSPKPLINGVMNATIDASGDGQYAEIDDQGRYKVKLPLDLSTEGQGKASRWVRMAQPYAGANYGMHFPLHKGTEVLLTFVGGDPDRPIIAGSVPNPETASPITAANQTRSMIRTGGGNELIFEDNDGGQLVKLTSPTEGTFFRIGATNPQNPPGIDMGSNGHLTTTVGGHEVRHVNGKYEAKIGGNWVEVVTGDVKREHHSNSHKIVTGNQTEETYGNKDSKVLGNTSEVFSGIKTSRSLAATAEQFVGVKQSSNMAATLELFAGIKTSGCLAASIEKAAGPKLLESAVTDIEAKGAIRLKCGGSKLSIYPSMICLESESIFLEGSGETRVIKGKFKVVDGEAEISKGLLTVSKGDVDVKKGGINVPNGVVVDKNFKG